MFFMWQAPAAQMEPLSEEELNKLAGHYAYEYSDCGAEGLEFKDGYRAAEARLLPKDKQEKKP